LKEIRKNMEKDMERIHCWSKWKLRGRKSKCRQNSLIRLRKPYLESLIMGN
jgi:hypothetical protein